MKLSPKNKSKASSKPSAQENSPKKPFPNVFGWLSKNEGKTVQDAIAALGLKMFTDAELAPIVDRVVAANKQQVEKMGNSAFGLSYGHCDERSAWKGQP